MLRQTALRQVLQRTTSFATPLSVRSAVRTSSVFRSFSDSSKDGRVGEGSHSDFQKQVKDNHHQHNHGHSHDGKPCDGHHHEEAPLDVNAWLSQVVKEHPVVLFMKGSPEAPKCGFSKGVVDILDQLQCEFASADVLENEEIRAQLKIFSNWPTFPQLYIGGEFIGGADIVKDLHKNNELKPMMVNVGAIKQ